MIRRVPERTRRIEEWARPLAADKGLGRATDLEVWESAARRPGVDSNALPDESRVDALSGNAVLKGIPLEIAPV